MRSSPRSLAPSLLMQIARSSYHLGTKTRRLYIMKPFMALCLCGYPKGIDSKDVRIASKEAS
jgi:hypothetical protein